MFKKMAGALIGKTLNDLGLTITEWNVTSENFELWLSLQKALDALTSDDRYDLVVWTCKYYAHLHTGGLEQNKFSSGMDIIKNDVSVSLEHNSKNGKRLILIRKGYARELPSPSETREETRENRNDIVCKYSGIKNVDIKRIYLEQGMQGYIHDWFKFYYSKFESGYAFAMSKEKK